MFAIFGLKSHSLIHEGVVKIPIQALFYILWYQPYGSASVLADKNIASARP